MIVATEMTQNELEWARPRNGMIAGVCSLFAKRLGVETWIVRAMWLASILLFGCGLFAYLILAVSLPLEGPVADAMRPRIFGVCARIARRTRSEIGLIRLISLLLLFVSGGTVLLLYAVLALVLPKDIP